jgi:hypothetical protein
MRIYRLAVFLGLLLSAGLAFTSSQALAATPSFTISATNVTMSTDTSSGTGSTTFTLTSISGYTGTVAVGCIPPTSPAGVTVPLCNVTVGVPRSPNYTLAANQVATGYMDFANAIEPCNKGCPASLPRRVEHGLAPSLALAGVLLIGFGFRSRAPRWLVLMLCALGTLAGLAGISACANNNVVTPGTYAYTITVTDVNTGVSVNASVNVTVP